eukprot:m.477506 g.477506  ORF g.477506 m.477506 type:complete len:85 (+) comp43846_c0_seq1:78-332(+)
MQSLALLPQDCRLSQLVVCLQEWHGVGPLSLNLTPPKHTPPQRVIGFVYEVPHEVNMTIDVLLRGLIDCGVEFLRNCSIRYNCV